MESRIDQTTVLHDRGYNCAQSVACAYADLVGADLPTVFRLCEAYGLGVGCKKGTCGALLGACAVAGLANSDGNLEQPASKRSTYAISARIFERFEQAVGSTVCGDIRGEDAGQPLMPCGDAIATAARILEEELLASLA